MLGSAAESKSSSVTLMKEQIEVMENEIEAQRIELRYVADTSAFLYHIIAPGVDSLYTIYSSHT